MLPLELIPLSVYQAVLNTQPFWIALISWTALKAKVYKSDLIAMLVAYSGILIVSFAPSDEQLEDQNHASPTYFLFGVTVTTMAAIGLGVISLMTKRLQNVNHNVINFHAGWSIASIYLVACIGEALLKQRLPLNLPFTTWLVCLTSSLCNVMGLTLLTIALQNGDPLTISLLGYTITFYSAVADIFVFGVTFTSG